MTREPRGSRELEDLMTAAVQRATADLTRRAEAEDLVDVAYASVDSPFGPMLTAVTDEGLVTVVIDGDDEAHLDRIARDISPRILESPARLDDVRRQLDEYFEGQRRDFDTPVDWRLVKGFSLKVLQATAAIPYGRVSTYKDMAIQAGSPKASRAAGNALGSNPIPIVVPCHRVLHSGGGLGGYGGGLPMKKFLLELEGSL
jgi:methylated-DNA-[protein]-cysteine S-methyltransferase